MKDAIVRTWHAISEERVRHSTRDVLVEDE